MPRDSPHPQALFSLVATSTRGDEVIADPCNSHLVSRQCDGNLGLDVGHLRSRSRGTLATLGRNGCDITVRGSDIAQCQCSFEMDNAETGIVMLYDRSHDQSTLLLGEDSTGFKPDQIRRVVVAKKINEEIGMGVVTGVTDPVEFRLKWHARDQDRAAGVTTPLATSSCASEEDPGFARIVDETWTVLPSRRMTRLHVSRQRTDPSRYRTMTDLVGAGQFGKVHKAVDVDLGTVMAVKTIRRPPWGWNPRAWKLVKREVETLSRISHPRIIDYITSQGGLDANLKIYMGLKDGSLEQLMRAGTSDTESLRLADILLPQMLEALDHLAFHGIIHRDLKPENILYSRSPDGGYDFCLSDFGLCNGIANAFSQSGTLQYMAPEVYYNGEDRQTSKVDCWSLFLTLAHVTNAAGYRGRPSRTIQERLTAASLAAQSDTLLHIKEMAICDPTQRASAAQMLVKLYDGAGLTTPRQRIPPLPRFESGPGPCEQQCVRRQWSSPEAVVHHASGEVSSVNGGPNWSWPHA